MGDVRAAQVRAEMAWREGDVPRALDQLDLGIAALGCLVELVEPPVAARMFLLRGGLLARSGDLDLARGELASAWSLTPGVRWDEGLPSEGAALLAEVAAAVNPHSLAVLPTGTTSGPWLDGRQVVGGSASVLPGLHLLQATATAGIRSAWLVVEGEATLVFPASFRRPILERMREPATWGEVEGLLRATLPDFHSGYVLAEGGLWLVAAEEATMVVHAATPLPPPVELAPPGQRGGKRRAAAPPTGAPQAP